ncbi:hypothetical protein IW140_000532 [Coemansia sp. RSA 1813]|nr:hypothetical protein EV178_004043 [Coemansia sp. RSA 1646]KAJ1773998.1 hypothetical protein LPJ74_000097 [Coemansia sp. RSA 1843]KAJ2092610.1 hypothetical protein IW138_001048 [Coemansia sp. RSA 986]KAJ2213368.1 hypothetical protein EV179_003877 [Coemansia sp. RSA 487]KAJ2572769.1 hypothetical protein IW140_000532 [Coemansia sp. RSA 1813]
MTTILAQRSDLAHSSDWAFKQLFKLESECRSQTPAMQVKAIGQFPKLLDQFPFPTLVSSAFLKLGDLFRSSSNSMRYHIAQVFESSRHHLLQITHTEELLKRIISVLYSNDPIARVLALRLIGNASVLFAKYPEAQHGVLLRYQSAHPLEIAAAVQTTELMLKYSPELLKIVWETVISKAKDSQVSDPVRAQLIHSLQHAASNLQLSIRLYDYCRAWVYSSESTTTVRIAALGTWKETIQPHNELKLKDAAAVADYVSHSINAISNASLALLAKWRHGGVSSKDISDSADILTIIQKLNECIRVQFDHSIMAADFRCIRLATMTLAHIESAPEYRSIPRCWELAEIIYGLSLRVLRGDVSMATTILDYAQKGAFAANMCDSDSADLQTTVDHAKMFLQLAKTTFLKSPSTTQDGSNRQAYRAFIRSIMMVVNVASVLRETNIQQSAATIVASAWYTISRLQGAPYETDYTKQFLKVTWKWCRSVNMGAVISDSFYELLAAKNRCVVHAIVSILALNISLSEQLAKKCIPNVEQLVSSLDSSGTSQQKCQDSFWKSVAALLIYRMQLLASNSSRRANDDHTLLAAEAVTKWSQYMLSQNASSYQVYAASFARLGPPAHLCRRIMSLLSSCGDWSALAYFCRALQQNKFSNSLYEWIHAIYMLADAESKSENIGIYDDLTDRSLCVLRTLSNQTGTHHIYQQFLIQLQKEFISIIDGWKRVGSTDIAQPSLCFITKSLSERTHAIANQINYVSSSFVCMDNITRGWIDNMQSIVGSIIRVLAFSKCNNDLGQSKVLEINSAIIACIEQCDTTKLVVGPSFFSKQTNPEISTETRPNLEGDTTTVVFSGSQFHFTVEGFIRFPADRLLAVVPRRINVSVWLSQHPFREDSSHSLQLCTHFNNIAWKRNGTSQASHDHLSATGYDGTVWSTIWDSATMFSTTIDSTYFACPCAIAIPSLHSLFGQVDTNMAAHVHVMCALVDSSDRVWYIGPYKSYPLTISTTARS